MPDAKGEVMKTRIAMIFAMMTVPFFLASPKEAIKSHIQSDHPSAVIRTWDLFASVDRSVFVVPRAVASTTTSTVPVGTTTTVAPTVPVAASTTTTEALESVLTDATSVSTPDWQCVGWNESRNNYAEDGGGRWQFEMGTFASVTELPSPAEDYSPAVQDAAALKLYAWALRTYGDGFHPWSTRFVCGL